MADIFEVNDKVQKALEKYFQQHRLVFWYDDKADMKSLFESMRFADIEKLVIANNEFGIKHTVLIEKPKQKFLIYQPKPKPEPKDNWLLDLNLSNVEFYTDASSIVLQELGLTQEYKTFIQQHLPFFSLDKRTSELKALLEPDEREGKIKLKMLAVACQCEVEWEKILYTLFAEVLKGKQTTYKAIENFNLDAFLWEVIEKKYAYTSKDKTIKDFLLVLINDNLQRSLAKGKPNLNKDAYLFVNRWKENIKARQSFEDWSKKLEQELNVESLLQQEEASSLLEADTYAVIDKKIIFALKNHIQQETLSNTIIQEWINKRRTKFFFTQFTFIYDALSFGASLLDEIRKTNLSITNPFDGFEKYAKSLYVIDRLYRKYIYSCELAEHQNILKDLTAIIEKAYENSYLLHLNDNWQVEVDKMQEWEIDKVTAQKQFFQTWVEPYLKKDNRVFVIISDGLRFESATELRERVLQEDRYTATLTPVLGSLPSYTQLGMASLLPHKAITFNDKTEIVFAEGQSTQGTPNRTKVLQSFDSKMVAISAVDFLKMNAKSDGRDFIKPYNVIYIYSNIIDKTGDDKTSESKVFEATESEFDNLVKIMKQVSNMNGYNMIITADHGYLYQHNRLEASDFTDFTTKGEVYKTSRRFILGKNLTSNDSVKKWTGEALGFADDTEALIPKSINRLRIQGAGSRYVHGGSSLQEIVIPVLEINKARKSDIEQVEIDVSSPSYNITSNTFGVSFYQKNPIGDKVLLRDIKAAFYTKDNMLISDVSNIKFDSRDTDVAAREQRKAFVFTSEASKLNGQDVFLKLEESIEGTSHFKIYKTITYRMLIAFSSEFDDF
jgi:uncharacterized protein (TIGR02687 family)